MPTINESAASTIDSLLCAGEGHDAAGEGRQPYAAPGNQFPVPTIIDTKGQFLACVPTIINAVTALP